MDENSKTSTKEMICRYLKEGLHKKDAAIMAGVSEPTLYRWLEGDESFKSQVEASVLEYKRSIINNLTRSTEKDGRLALEVLRRRFPSEWGDNVIHMESDNNSSIKTIEQIVDGILEDEDDDPKLLS